MFIKHDDRIELLMYDSTLLKVFDAPYSFGQKECVLKIIDRLLVIPEQTKCIKENVKNLLRVIAFAHGEIRFARGQFW